MRATLSHYRLLEQIGAGGMGVVYRARDERLERDVALKVLPQGALADEPSRKRFRKEALALSRLNHPNIAVVHDFDTQDGTDFLVQELIPGLTLSEMVLAPLSEREIINLGSQLCEGLAAAHEQGVVHRDLKPENVRVTPGARLKILDFGLATIIRRVDPLAATASLTESQTVCGTLPYMAPEQLLNEKLDARTDIWAAGCVLYEMATGRRPFHASGPSLIEAILHQAPPPPSKLNHKVTPGLEALILKCLEKDPSLRYQSAREIAVDLQRLRSSSTMLRPAVRPARLRKTALQAALVLLLVLAMAGVFWLARGRKPESPAVPPSIAVLPFTDMSADNSQEYFSEGIAEELLDTLARIPQLRVAARTSSFHFKGKDVKLADIGRELHVATVLEGSVRTEGTHVRISAQLVKVSDGFTLWSQTYDKELTDVFAVQEEIAHSVAASLKVTLLGAKTPAAQETNPQAYSAYLQGQYFRLRRNQEDLRKAVRYYQQAIDLDPTYALAWSGLAAARSFQATIGFLPFHEGCQKARDAAQRALVLDPNLAEAYVAMVRIQMYCDWDWTGADRSSQRAAALAPGNVSVLEAAANVDSAMGRFDRALALRRQVVERDPLNPSSYVLLGLDAYSGGRLEEAVTAFKKALELNPDNPAIHTSLGRVFLAQGHPQEALAEAEKEPSVGPPLGWRLQGVALACHALGREQESAAAFRQMIAKFQGNMAFQIAEVYAFRGQAVPAFAWLDRALAQRDAGFIHIKGDPLLQPLERDPRYTAVLAKLGLPK
jgi:TolB-like protein/cytochrome c-type biogenesis protein CcmH/NrfG